VSPPREALVEAAARWGTPLYVTDLDAAVDNLAAYRRAFTEALIAYAVKANPDRALLRRLVADGAGCEVVNAVELEIALRAGCPPERMVMNGIGKTDDDIRAGLNTGVLVNAESLDELADLVRVAAPATRIGLRLNPGLDAGTHAHLATGAADAKFGISIDDVDAALGLLPRPAAIGAHIGSDIASPEPFRSLVEVLAQLAARLPDTVIDLGGGLRQADRESLAALRVAIERLGADRRLILEPGRSLVADAGFLLTRVLRVQRRQDSTHLIVDSGMTELLRPMLYGAEHPVRVIAPGVEIDAADGPISLAGPVCEAGDILVRDLRPLLPPDDLARAGHGALLAIERAGAYGAAMASNYNGRLRPAQVVVDGGELRLSVRRETLDDLVRRDAM
jgi:diaminopimelate decarboxylase